MWLSGPLTCLINVKSQANVWSLIPEIIHFIAGKEGSYNLVIKVNSTNMCFITSVDTLRTVVLQLYIIILCLTKCHKVQHNRSFVWQKLSIISYVIKAKVHKILTCPPRYSQLTRKIFEKSVIMIYQFRESSWTSGISHHTLSQCPIAFSSWQHTVINTFSQNTTNVWKDVAEKHRNWNQWEVNKSRHLVYSGHTGQIWAGIKGRANITSNPLLSYRSVLFTLKCLNGHVET